MFAIRRDEKVRISDKKTVEKNLSGRIEECRASVLEALTRAEALKRGWQDVVQEMDRRMMKESGRGKA